MLGFQYKYWFHKVLIVDLFYFLLSLVFACFVFPKVLIGFYWFSLGFDLFFHKDIGFPKVLIGSLLNIYMFSCVFIRFF